MLSFKTQCQWLCVREGQTKKEKPQKNRASSFSFSNHESYRHVIYLFVCVYMGDKDGVCQCIRRLPGLPQLTHHSDDDKRVGHSPEQLFRQIPHIAKEKTRRGLRKLVGILQQWRGQWGGINPLQVLYIGRFCYEVLLSQIYTCLNVESVLDTQQEFIFQLLKTVL